MKSKAAYEDKFNQIFATAGQEGHVRMQLELLLDIRELLLEEKEDRDLKKTIEERVKAERMRLSKVRMEE